VNADSGSDRVQAIVSALVGGGSWRDVIAWFGDRLPGRLGSWLLRISDDSTEPWVDAEGRIIRGR
jgi:hypothetical protein